MKMFKDNAGRTWTFAIHVTAVKRCRAALDVDIISLIDDKFEGLAKLLGDPIQFVDLLYVLCQDEAEKAGVTNEQFGCAMAGDAIEHAADAFLAELTDFFQNPRIRAGLTKVIQSSRKVRDRLMDHLEAKVETIDVEAEAEKLIASFGASQGSSESTPDPSLSANSP